jgi:ribose 5-phosphate isomerase B
MTKIFIGSDHAGFQLKEAIIQELILEHEITDCGTTSTDSTDYPIYAHTVAEGVLETSHSIGILICSTGIGMSIAANRHRGIRAALCHSVKESKLARHHNNANVLVLGASNTAVDVALDMIKSFLATPFDGGRHERRIHQIDA